MLDNEQWEELTTRITSVFFSSHCSRLSTSELNNLDRGLFYRRFLLGACPRCRGALERRDDFYGWYLCCVHCGYHRDTPPTTSRSHPAPLTAHTPDLIGGYRALSLRAHRP